jgi:hypothetical protein
MSHSRFLRGPRWSIPTSTVLLAMLLAVSHLPGQQVTIERKFRAGDDYRHRNVQTSRIATPAGDVTQTITMMIRTTVLAVEPDGSATVRTTHESVQIQQASPMGRIDYDSRAGTPLPTNPMFAPFAIVAALAGKSIEAKLGPDGKAVSTSGLDEIREEMVAIAAPNNPALAARLRESLRSASADDLVGNANVRVDQALPSRPVAPGDEWTGDVSVGTDQTRMRLQQTYTLVEVGSEGGRRIARVGIKGTMTRETDAANPGTAVGAMNGDILGEMTFDLDRGVMLRSTQTQVITAQLMGQTMRTESSGTSELVP